MQKKRQHNNTLPHIVPQIISTEAIHDFCTVQPTRLARSQDAQFNVTVPLAILLGSFTYHPSPFLPPPPTLAKRKTRIEGKGVLISLEYFLLIKGIKFLGTILILIVRIYPNSNPATSTSSRGNSSRESISHLSQSSGSLKSPQNSKYTLSSLGKIMRLPDHETNHSQLL